MEIKIDTLFMIIGQQTVEIELLRQQLKALTADKVKSDGDLIHANKTE